MVKNEESMSSSRRCSVSLVDVMGEGASSPSRRAVSWAGVVWEVTPASQLIRVRGHRIVAWTRKPQGP